MVPLTRRTLYIDLFQRWGAPVVLVARTSLGTINHSLLSIEALRTRDIPILGIVFSGEPMPDNERTICEFAGIKRLGRCRCCPGSTRRAAGGFRGGVRPRGFRAALGR